MPAPLPTLLLTSTHPRLQVSGPFNPIVYAEDNTGGGAGGGVGARSRRGLGSTFDGASAAGFDR